MRCISYKLLLICWSLIDWTRLDQTWRIKDINRL